MTSTEEMMEFLYKRRAQNLPPSALADVFGRLMWSMDDEGELLTVQRKWLESEERGKVEIALAMNELFPGKTREEMTSAFSKITSRWPDLNTTCLAILEQWDRQMTSACTVLCPTIDFGKVLDAIQSASASDLSLEGTRDNWTRITVVYSYKQITFSVLVRMQPGDKFSRTVLSMHNFFRTVKSDVVSNQKYVLSRIANVQMMIGVVADPKFAENDSRLNILWHIARCMDALIFNDDAILDMHGQRILDHYGEFDVVVE